MNHLVLCVQCIVACRLMYGAPRWDALFVSNVRNTQCTGVAETVCNPEFIIQGLLGLQLAWHQQAFLLRGGGGPLPHSLKPAGGFGDWSCTGMRRITEADDS